MSSPLLPYVFQNAHFSECITVKASATGFYRHAEAGPSFILWDSTGEGLSVYHVVQNQQPEQVTTPFVPGKATGTHQHEDIEILYVIQGSISQNIAGETYHFQQHEVVLINQGIPHFDYLPARDSCILFLSIPNTLFIQLFRNSIHSPYKNFIADLLVEHKSDYTHIHGTPKTQVRAGGYFQAEQALLEICREIANTQPGSTHIIRGNIIRLIYHLALEYHFDLPEYSQANMRKLLFDEITADIKKDCRNTTIESLQKKYYFNRDYFNRLIKEFSGYTFRELRQNIRLEEAKRLLLETDTRVDDVALAVGYENRGFFYRLFAKKYGKTPREYRLAER
ncbi:MAG: helix-turn-helix domain-containing protein [Oscillospiraceae bacterium]|nr:helix-turn-helix domain-containing protein [Oscillospiraceae bacterium]